MTPRVKPLSNNALRVLSTVVVSGQTAAITQGQLTRDLYVEVNKALEALGGKWSRKLKAHVFDRTSADITDALEDVIACQGFVDKKQELGQFFTPAALTDQLVSLADIKPGMHVLEPSAGQGAIVGAIARAEPRANVTAVEIAPENVKALRTGHFGGTPTMLLVADQVIAGDFLQLTSLSHRGLYDRIVMNPPFRRNADIEHVLHAWKFLKRGGRLVSVMSGGVTFRQDKAAIEFRAFVRKNAPRLLDARALPVSISADGLLLLPDGSFAASGTNVSTVVVVLEKPL